MYVYCLEDYWYTTLLTVLFSLFTTKLRKSSFSPLYAIYLNIHIEYSSRILWNFFWYLYVFKIIADVKMDEGAVLVGNIYMHFKKMEVFSCWLLTLVFSCKSIFQGLIMPCLDEDDYEQCFLCLLFHLLLFLLLLLLSFGLSLLLLFFFFLFFLFKANVTLVKKHVMVEWRRQANVRQLRSRMAVKLWTSDLTPLKSSFLIKMINELLNANLSWIYEFILWARKHQVSPFLSSCGYGFSRICFYSHLHFLVFAVVQLLSPVQLFSIPWTAAR